MQFFLIRLSENYLNLFLDKKVEFMLFIKTNLKFVIVVFIKSGFTLKKQEGDLENSTLLKIEKS